ncbi:MAG: cytochrome c3 family protein [Gammaproteobacteria bacterium]|nr:cytochrome c3 family protein [Gammaproteobacteria bacterium]MDH5800845.1 cytochrome c3 family protein [Gammaproteobacteria bacterium]
MKHLVRSLTFWALLCVVITAFADGWSPATRAPNTDSISKTRHNLTMSYLPAITGGGAIMDNARNNYGEICVYCHTPHGTNTTVDALPLWNRTINTGTYTIYDKPRTLDRPIGQPGPNSLTCLSCHDGTIAIDSIINMPGSGNYSEAQKTSMNPSFLDTWPNAAAVHATMGPSPGTGPANDQSCMYCHSTDPTAAAQSLPFNAFALGTDLRDDHPIGILFPTVFEPGVDFNEPNLIYRTPGGAQMQVFDLNSNGYPDKDEPRLYDTGEGFEVECASCHDPHGVPSGGPGSTFNPSFLRVNNGVVGDHQGTLGIVSNSGSALCLTCHAK